MSTPVKPGFGRYVNDPSELSVSFPCDVAVTRTADKGAPLKETSLDRMPGASTFNLVLMSVL